MALISIIISSGDGSVDFGDNLLQLPSEDLVQLAPGCSLSGEDRQVSPQAQVSTFNNRVLNPTFCQIRSKDKAPCPSHGGMGPAIRFIQGLRVSYLRNLKEVYGPKTVNA
jgi:hypothetical protein